MMRDISKAVLDKPLARYALAIVVVAASLLLRYALVRGLGLTMPPFITFFPAIIIVAVLAGLWPGLLATALAALAADYFILPPFGFGIVDISDIVALILFATMGAMICLLAENYRRGLLSIAAYKEEQALWVSNKKLDVALASMTDAVFISDAKGQFIQFNDAFASFHRFRNKSECATTLAEYPEFLEVSMADGQLAPLEMWAVPRALRGETAASEEYRLRRKDTGETWIGSYSFAPVRDPEGVIIGSVVVGRDITEQKRAEEALRKSETLYHGLFDSMDEGFCIIEMIFDAAGKPADYRFLEINAAFEKQTGMHDAAGKRMRELVPTHEEHWFEIYGKIALTGEPAHFLNEAKALNAYYEVSAYRVGEPELRQVAIVFSDISGRMKAEAHIRQLNRVYSVLSDINQTIVREKDSQTMLAAACRIAVDKGQFRMAWIGMINPDTQVLEPVAFSGVVEGYFDQINIDFRESEPDSGPAAHCFHTGEHAICNDIEHELNQPWRGSALQHGYRSMAAFPLLHEGKIIGIFCLYAGELAFFDDDETKLLNEMAMDISFALEVNRHEEQRRQAEKHVRQLNRVYSVLSDINQTIVREKDSQAMLAAACRIAVDKGQFLMAWIGTADSETHALRPIASSGEVGDYLDRLQLDFLDPARSAGPSVQCFLSGKHVICNALEEDPRFAPWRDDALRMGYRSHASFPLKVDAQVAGIFNFYSSELAFFDEDEIRLLDELAMDIGFALEVNRREEDRRKAEEELRWRTAFFEAQVDSASDGVLVVDRQDRKILQNQRMNDMMQIPKEIAEDPDDMRQREYVRSSVRNPDRFIEKVVYLNSHPDEVLNDEVELLNGTIIERYSSPVRDKAGNHYGRIWTFRDITERRQLEEQFRQSQKMEALGQLTGGIAHDFNNLLTVILGCSAFIGEEAKENPRLSKMAKMILDAAQRGADLTHRMLAFARRQPLQPKPVDINRMLANMESILRRTLSADIDLEVIQSGEDCTALVDPPQLENALLNLCMNAWDAMPGGGKLIVETGIATLDSSYAEQNADVTPGKYVLISVSDTGCGISPENLGRVFDPFFTTKEVGKGTGLGLSMVYGFVKQSQGHVKIYSESGQGTSVKLYLPRADQESEPADQEAILIADLHGSEVILLVEDNAPVREFAKTQLLHLGYQVLEAANGKDALAVLREHNDIDLLFTDVVMPGGLNGRELAHEARQLYPALKVLFTSGYAESAILDMGLLDQHVQLLNKPYSRLQLARRIRGMLAARQSAPEEEGLNG
jgi:signal transduction histidine kinase/CheY-like chemotaxis protein/putative methionine-R-sulfoxide reductase with GAF domain